MILLVLLLGLRLSMACQGDNIDCHGNATCNLRAPAPSDDHSEALCSTLRTLGQSLEDVLIPGGCVDSESRAECTTSSLEVLKTCLDVSEVDHECLVTTLTTLAEGDDKDCFCGGIIKYFEMLTSVEALHCSSSHHGSSVAASSQGHVTNDLSFSEQYCKTAHLRQTMGRATYDLFCKDVKPDQECVGVTLEDFTSSNFDVQGGCFCGGMNKVLSMGEIMTSKSCEEKNLLGAAAPSLESSLNLLTMCSFAEIFSCTQEIMSAYTHCMSGLTHLSIGTCISDIMGASNCYKCVCSVLSFACVGPDLKDSLLGAAAPSLESSPDSGVLDLFEGNGATQNQVCTLRWADQDVDLNFKHYDACENDEARSGILRAAASGTTITLYDSPSGSKGDDYTVIKVKTSSLDDLPQGLTFDTFEQSQSFDVGDGTVEMTYYRHNGLDGKISRVEISVF